MIVMSMVVLVQLATHGVRQKISVLKDSEIKGYDNVFSYLMKNIETIKKNNRSLNWYLQQYLKLATAWYASERIFISDGDTIFSVDLIDKISKSPILLATKENVSRYNNGLKLLGLPCNCNSFIANGGIFEPSELNKLNTSAETWFISSLNTLLTAEIDCDFSEYQIQGSLLAYRMQTKKLNFFRRFDLIKDISNVRYMEDQDIIYLVTKALKKYDAISFEPTHKRSNLKRILAKIAYSTNYSW